MENIGVIGPTSWGTTLAILLASKQYKVHLICRSPEEAKLLDNDRENKRLLPGGHFPSDLTMAGSIDMMPATDLLIFAIPSKTFKENVRICKNYINQHQPIILSATKGLERDTGNRISEIIKAEVGLKQPKSIAILSGPNFAKEILNLQPSSGVVACTELAVARHVQDLLSTAHFRLYTSNDIIGVELGGALKNPIAIGAGIVDGLELGTNAKAALATRALAEIINLGSAAGADPATFKGLSGLGDLIATCFSPLSRNRYVGEQIAKGKTLKEILESMDNVAEGTEAIIGALKLSEKLAINMPIMETIYEILFNGLEPREAIVKLMSRPLKSE